MFMHRDLNRWRTGPPLAERVALVATLGGRAFNTARADYGMIVWNDNIDIASESV